jgi:peptidoglycan/LPS O-acetylase OafA/YrhL
MQGREPRHVPALDGIRGLAILAVIIAHFRPSIITDPVQAYVWAVPYFGWLGVDLFFALSGFLITGILLDTKGTTGWLWKFYVRRTLRIFPLYFGFLALLFVFLVPLAAHTFPAQAAAVRENAEWYWTYTLNILIALEGEAAAPIRTVHLWSLAVEEQFYLVWPWVALLLSRTGLLRLCGALLGISAGLRLLASFGWTPFQAPEYFTLVRMDGIVAGSMLAAWVRGPVGWDVLPDLVTVRRALVFAAPAVLLLMFASAAVPRPVRVIVPTAWALLFAGAVAYAARAPEGRARWSRELRFLGKYSYGLYVVHFPMLLFLELSGVRTFMSVSLSGQIAFIGLGALCSLAVAVPSWHLFEAPILSLKRYVEYKPATVQTVESRLSRSITEMRFP